MHVFIKQPSIAASMLGLKSSHVVFVNKAIFSMSKYEQLIAECSITL